MPEFDQTEKTQLVEQLRAVREQINVLEQQLFSSGIETVS